MISSLGAAEAEAVLLGLGQLLRQLPVSPAIVPNLGVTFTSSACWGTCSAHTTHHTRSDSSALACTSSRD